MPADAGLDAGPPLPPGMTAQTPPANLQQMAGSQPPQGGPAQSSSLQQSVIQDFMLAEKALQSAASKLPSLAPIVDGLIQQLRSQGAMAIQSSAQPSGAPASPMQSALSSIGAAPQM